LVEQNNLALARPIFEGGQFEAAIGQVRWVGIESAGGAAVADRVFFNAKRTLSRPSWTPVCCATTWASSRQLHWEWREPCVSGS
jgi:hypothetical protein